MATRVFLSVKVHFGTINLIYSGHEASAWQFLDMVWPRNKRGKAIFIRDFKRMLAYSEYWKPNRR